MLNAAKKYVEFRETAAVTSGGRAQLKLVTPPLISQAVIHRLAVSDSGFVFDPVSGQSFSLNESGLALLRIARDEPDTDKVLAQLAQQFDASAEEIRRDVLDFANRLKDCFK